MTRKDVIDQSIKALVGIAQTLSLGARAIEEIVDADFVDGQVYVLINEVLGSLQDAHEAIENEIRDYQLKALYDFVGSSEDNNCPSCNHEMIELDEDRYVCIACGYE
jgi:hypothetical protein